MNLKNIINSDLETHAFPSVISAAKEYCFDGSVTLHHVSEDIITASVCGPEDAGCGCFETVIAGCNGESCYECTCGYDFGGMCEHTAAVIFFVKNNLCLLSENNRQKMCLKEKPVLEKTCSRPEPRIYLTEHYKELYIELRFAYKYGWQTCEFKRGDKTRKKIFPAENGKYFLVSRSKTKENEYCNILLNNKLQRYNSSSFVPEGGSGLWLENCLDKIISNGFTVFGDKKLERLRVRKGEPGFSVSISSHSGNRIDCSVDLSIEGIPLSLKSVADSIVQNENFVILSDGTRGFLPDKWREIFSWIFDTQNAVFKYEEDKILLDYSGAAWADILCETADRSETDSSFEKLRKLLKKENLKDSIPVPDSLKCSLRYYQKYGYQWLTLLSRAGLGACLADDMGLGKTVQTLALLLKEKEMHGNSGCSLIIVPASLMFNWENENARFSPSLRILRYHGKGRERFTKTAILYADIILTTYGTAVKDVDKLSEIYFNYVILDEAQAIKNPFSKTSRNIRKLKSRNRLAISGTPLENRLSELWSLFSFLNPAILGSLQHFNSIFSNYQSEEEKENQTALLKKSVFPFILRRKKEQVEKELPAKSESKIITEMTAGQKKLYDITRDSFRGRIMNAIERKGRKRSNIEILEGLLRLRQICCHPLLVDETSRADSCKFNVLLSLIPEAIENGHKVLVFSQFISLLNLLRAMLQKSGYSSLILTGKTKNREKIVNIFQDSADFPLFLISLKAGGTGLNLTSADYVIHLDPWWNPAVENQASDRVYRIGQTKPVFVYKILVRNSVEDKIIMLQESKKDLADNIVTTDETIYKSMSSEDIITVFS